MSVTIALLGCGTVGTEVARLLTTQAEEYAHRAGGHLELIGIAVRDASAPRDPAIDPGLLTENASELATKADICIELIGGIEPARTLILEAIEAGASIVTGNKALLAAHGPEIYEAARKKNVDVYYEAAVAGAVPVVYALRESLAGDKIDAVIGIVNGTTNYILDEMDSSGLSFDEALAQAQELGFAEADPTADVDGHDAAQKAAILASLAFHTRVNIEDVPVTGIRDITTDSILAAREAGYALKLLASARRQKDGIDVRVEPTLLPLEHPLASVRGSFNAVVVEAQAADRLMFYGRGAGGAPTASAVLGDVVAAAAHRVKGGEAPRELDHSGLTLIDPAEAISSFRIVLEVTDKLGVLAEISGLFAQAGVSISTVQQEGQPGGLAHLTISTHPAPGAAIDTTLDRLRSAEYARSIVEVRRVEEA
ncbi:MAG: homoserine dehydrogenase [Flaviflexus sp.]|nr:homoserine dehydrogenase [Flaviflexus sp.]